MQLSSSQQPELQTDLTAIEPSPYDYEPDCTCVQIDVDYFDARYCELCNRQSEWNRELRAWQRSREQPVQAPAPEGQPAYEWVPITDDDTPF